MMHTDGTNVNRKVAKGRETRAEIVAVGRARFGADGYAETSMDHIAAAAGVTKGALYHHFTGKPDLFRAVYEEIKREITEQVAPSFLEPAPRDALLAGCEATLDAHLDPEVRQIVMVDGPSVLGADAIHEIEGRYGAIVLRGALRRAMHAGDIRRAPLPVLSQMLNGALVEACVLITASADPEQTRAEVRGVLAQLFDALSPIDEPASG